MLPRLLAAAAALLVCLPAQAQLSGTLAKIKEARKITLGIRENIPPFSYLDDHQKVVGFSIDICMKIVEAVKRELGEPDLEIATAPVTSSSRIPLMVNGSIDLECGTTTNNVERQKQVAFSNTFFLSASKLMAKKSSGVRLVRDLKGKAVSTVSGSTTVPLLIRANNDLGLGLNIIGARDTAEGFLLLETDRAAAFAMDDVQLAIMAALSRDPAAYAIGEENLNDPEPYGIMLRRDDPAFKAVVDRATGELFRSPEMAALYARWFTEPTPPKGTNYSFPMPPLLKKAFANPSDAADPGHYVK